MAEPLSAWELDAAWFHKNFPFVATEDETDAFCERIAVRMSEGETEENARKATLDQFIQRKMS